jgi:SAM-dependent methyltransferase
MKSGEIDYLKNLGPHGSQGAFDKPFSDVTRPKNLVDMGVVLALLPQPPARILDLGCGTGWTSWFLAKSGFDVVRQDIAPDMIPFHRMVDPTHLCLAAYGVNLQNGARLKGMVEQFKWGITLLRRALNPDHGAICILQK